MAKPRARLLASPLLNDILIVTLRNSNLEYGTLLQNNTKDFCRAPPFTSEPEQIERNIQRKKI